MCVCILYILSPYCLFLIKSSKRFPIHLLYIYFVLKIGEFSKTLNIRMTPRDHTDETYMNCRCASYVILRRCWLSICLIFQATGSSLLKSGLVHSGILYWRDNNYLLLICVTVLVYKTPLSSNFFYYIFLNNTLSNTTTVILPVQILFLMLKSLLTPSPTCDVDFWLLTTVFWMDSVVGQFIP